MSKYIVVGKIADQSAGTTSKAAIQRRPFCYFVSLYLPLQHTRHITPGGTIDDDFQIALPQVYKIPHNRNAKARASIVDAKQKHIIINSFIIGTFCSTVQTDIQAKP